MTAGVSSWWTTPTRPDRHFTDAELASSARHHRPLRRVGLASTMAKALLLVAALSVAGAISDHPMVGGAFDRDWPDDTGWLRAAVAPRVLIGSGLAVLAVWVPATAADAWFEFRFGRGRPDHEPVPVSWFMATTTMVALGSVAVVAPLTALAYRLAAVRSDWPVVLVGITAVGFAVAAVGERWIRQLSPDREDPVEPDSELGAEFDAVARLMGLGGLRFGTTTGTPTAGAVGPNAFSMGLGRGRRVVVTEALLAEDRTVRDFVIAHELTHIKRHHVLLQSMAQVALPVSTVAVLSVLADRDDLWPATGLDPFDPLGVAVVPLVLGAVSAVVGAMLSWLSRANERSADAGAAAATGPLPSPQARRLYVVPDVDLDPPWWVRLYSAHPAPAERLEFLSRFESAAASAT